LHDGNYPHLSTAIEYIRPDYKRVILGFNCFTKELAECNIRATEHSDAFNRTIKLYQMMSSLGLPITTSSSTTTMDDDDDDDDDSKTHHSDSRCTDIKYNNGSNITTDVNSTTSDGDAALEHNINAHVCDGSNNYNISISDGKNIIKCIPRSADKHVVGRSSSKGINVKDVMKNPALKRLLLMAAKKIKEQKQTTDGSI